MNVSVCVRHTDTEVSFDSFCCCFQNRVRCYSARGTICSAAGGPANLLPLDSSSSSSRDTTFTVSTIATSSTTLSGHRRWSGTEPDPAVNANSILIAMRGRPAMPRHSEWPPRSSHHRINNSNSRPTTTTLAAAAANCWRRTSFRVRIDSSFCALKPLAKVSPLVVLVVAE